MRIDRKWLGIGFLVGLLGAAVAYAATLDQIWQSVYDSSNSAIRINVVTSSGS